MLNNYNLNYNYNYNLQPLLLKVSRQSLRHKENLHHINQSFTCLQQLVSIP